MASPLKVALVGCGYIAQAAHVPALLDLTGEIEVVATVDHVLARAAALGAVFGVPSFASLADAVSAREFAAVIVCTPGSTHPALIEAAAAAGKAVLVEKPLGYHLAKVRTAIAAAERAGVKCMVGYQRRYDNDCLRVKQLIADGAIGDVRAAVSRCQLALQPQFRQYGETGPGVAITADQDLPADWLMENSIHHVNLLRFWLGDVTRIHSAVYRARDHNLGILTLEFPGFVLASHHQLRGMDANEEITLYGTKGNLHLELWYPHRPYHFPRLIHFTLDPPARAEVLVPRTSPYENEIKHFIRYVRGEADTASPLRDAYRDLEILSAVLEKAVYLEE